MARREELSVEFTSSGSSTNSSQPQNQENSYRSKTKETIPGAALLPLGCGGGAYVQAVCMMLDALQEA